MMSIGEVRRNQSGYGQESTEFLILTGNSQVEKNLRNWWVLTIETWVFKHELLGIFNLNLVKSKHEEELKELIRY